MCQKLNLDKVEKGNFSTEMARWPYLLVLIFLVGFQSSNQQSEVASEQQFVNPQIVISIESVPGSADVVQMSVADRDYSEQLLTQQIVEMAGNFGSEAQNLQILSATDEGVPLRAVFSAFGLINQGTGDLQLQPIVRAFMKGSDPPNTAFRITYHGVAPAAYTTLASYKSSTTSLQAFYDPTAQTLEYRIIALTNDPELLVIPTRYIPETFEPISAESDSRKTWLLGLLIILAGGSTGALVYFALLGRQA